jgi:myo-inositol-1(or 4)-monophosphatase
MSDPSLDERALVLKNSVLEAGKLARQYFTDRQRLAILLKGPQDIVTEADREVERLLASHFCSAFPSDGFLGEETGLRAGHGLWVVDPIDGTANFVRGNPHFCVTAAFVEAGEIKLGATLNPVTEELYFARLGYGATRNGEPIAVAETRTLAEASIEAGWSTRVPNAEYLNCLSRIFDAGAHVRRGASGALGLAFVADGRSDGYVELHANAWDCVAGLLLVQEAGGVVSPFLDTDGLRVGAPVLAASGGIAGALSEVIGIPLRQRRAPRGQLSANE